jgi:hypothetical protein
MKTHVQTYTPALHVVKRRVVLEMRGLDAERDYERDGETI